MVVRLVIVLTTAALVLSPAALASMVVAAG